MLELGGIASFAYWRDTTSVHEQLTLGVDLYAGFFPVRLFVLGFGLGATYFQLITGNTTVDYWTAGLNLSVRPGLVLPVGTKVFVSLQALLGLGYLDYHSSGDSLLGLFGAAGEVKIVLGPSTLLSIGMRPLFRVGRRRLPGSSWEDVKTNMKEFDLLFSVGFSWFR